jgi:hypothetical protein
MGRRLPGHGQFSRSGPPRHQAFDEAGLPLSLRIAGRSFEEATVLRAGGAYQRATAWRARRSDALAIA